MKAYFLKLASKTPSVEICSSQFNEYKESLILAMKEMGATEDELELLCDEIIFNSIRNNRKVEDVAWAILQ